MADGGGKGQGRGSGVGSCQSVIAQVHSGVGTDLQRLFDRVNGPRGTHAQCNDLVAGLGAAAFLSKLQRGLEGVFIQFGQDTFVTVRGVARSCDVPVELGVRDVLDQNDNLQCLFHCLRSSLPCLWTANRSKRGRETPKRVGSP